MTGFKKTAVNATLVVVCLAFLTMMLQAGQVAASPDATYYVSVNGADNENGLSWDSAKRTIENAILTAENGDNIVVGDGTYAENLLVNKSLTITSENGPSVTVVQTTNENDQVFEVKAENVTIAGFTIENATGGGAAGVLISGVENCRIENNILSNNFHNVTISSSSKANIENNLFGSSSTDIYLLSSSSNTVGGNTVANSVYGVYIYSLLENNPSENNVIENNTFNGNTYGVYIKSASSNTVSNNTVGSNQYGIYLISSNNNTFSNNTLENNGLGFSLESSENNTITNNSANSNATNMYLLLSNKNTADNNSISAGSTGIFLDNSENNTLTNNTISGNLYNFLIIGDAVSEFTQTIDNSNTINGKSMIYLVGEANAVVGQENDAGYIGLVQCDNAVVENVTIENNGQGVLLVSLENGVVRNNIFKANNFGIYLNSFVNGVVENNWVENSFADGIVLDNSSVNMISGNTASANNSGGVYLRSSTNNTLNQNSTLANYYGVFLYYSDGNDIDNGVVGKNYYGIRIESSSNIDVTNNKIENNNDSGIYMLGNSSNNTAHLNEITGNAKYGAYNANPDVTLSAENNWWGNSDGPRGDGPGTGYGDNVRGSINFEPWTTTGTPTTTVQPPAAPIPTEFIVIGISIPIAIAVVFLVWKYVLPKRKVQPKVSKETPAWKRPYKILDRNYR